VEESGVWRLIEWCDDVEGPFGRSTAGASDSAAFIEMTTWGHAKSLYAQ
jgi:hypothetical protein